MKVVGSISISRRCASPACSLQASRSPRTCASPTLELVRGEWRTYDFNLNVAVATLPPKGQLDVSVVNIEENDREPVNYVLPPGVTRITDPGQSQITQLNEQSMSYDAHRPQRRRCPRRVPQHPARPLRNYRRMQMWVHAEALIDNATNLRSGEMSVLCASAPT